MDVFDLCASIKLDSSDYDKGLDNAKGKMSGLGSKLADGLASAVKTAVKVTTTSAVAGASAVSALVTSAVKSYADYEQLVGGIETMFEDLSYDVIANADKAYMTAGLSANEYMETVMGFSASLNQSLIANEGNIARSASLSDQIIIDMSDNANKMGTSMESIQNAYNGFAKQNYTMLDNLKLGYGGTKEEMQRLLDDAQKLSGVKYDISNFADITEAIHVMQEEMGIAGTTAKEASETISGSIGMMKSSWSNLITAIANGEDWDIGVYVSNFVGTLETVFDNIKPVILKSLDGVNELIMNLVPKIAEILPPLIQEILPTLISSVGTLLSTLAQNFPALLQAIVPALIGAIDSIMSSVFGTEEGKVSEMLSELFSALNEVLPVILDAVMQVLPVILDVIMALIPPLTEVITAILPIISDLIKQIMPPITEIIQMLLPVLTDLIVAIIPIIQNVLNLLSPLISLVLAVIKPLVNIIGEILPPLIDIISTLISIMSETLQPIIMLIADILGNVLGTAFKVLQPIIEAIGKVFSTVFKAIKAVVMPIVNFIVDNVGSAFTSLKNTVSDIFNTMKDTITDIFDGIWSVIKGVINAILGGIEGMANGVISGINFMIRALNNLSFDVPDWVPVIGGSTFGFNLSELSKVSLPRLEKGGILEKGQLGLLEGNGAEAVVPLERNQKWIDAVTKDMESALGGGKTADLLQSVSDKLSEVIGYMPQLANMSVVMDTGATVGALAPQMNYELGVLANRRV